MPWLYWLGGVAGGAFLLFCLYLLTLRPARYRKETEKFVHVKYAHRGLWGEGAAENSLTAFRRAKKAGFGVELDVQLSKDGVLMVFHDATLERMTGVSGALCDYTAEELARMPLGQTEDGIPTLDEVLAEIGGEVPILMEIKSDNGWLEVSRAAAERIKTYEGPLCMESFHPLAVRYFAKNSPTTVRGLLWGRLFRYPELRRPIHFLLWCMCFNFLAKPDFIAASWCDVADPPITLLRAFYKSRYLVWTVQSEEEQSAVSPYTHGVIFDGYVPNGDASSQKPPSA